MRLNLDVRAARHSTWLVIRRWLTVDLRIVLVATSNESCRTDARFIFFIAKG